MITPDYCQLMARYNTWINQRFFDLCAEIPDDQRRQEAGVFFKSIHGTLNHLLYGDLAWMKRFAGQEDQVPALGEELYRDFGELRSARSELDLWITDWAGQLDPDWLASTIEFTSMVDGRTRCKPAWLLVSHMFNHSTHHRGQLTALLSRRGIDYGSMDLPFMPEI